MLKKVFNLVIFFGFFLAAVAYPIGAQESTDDTIIITSLGNNGSSEFIELYNASDETQIIDGWKVVYTNGSGNNEQEIAELSGSIPAGRYLLFTSSAYEDSLDPAIPSNQFLYNGGMADSGGYVWLYESAAEPEELVLVDRLGWGNASLDEDISLVSKTVAQKPTEGEALKRCVNADLDYVNRHNNELDFLPIGISHFDPGPYCAGMEPVVPPPAGDDPVCEEVIISELLPNPAGVDTTNEFIELYNSASETVNLEDCSLQLGTETPTAFGSVELTPGQYMAFSDDNTGITLTNGSSDETEYTLYLLSGGSAPDELDEVVYPGGLGDDVAWAWFEDDGWQQTYSPTPGAENIKQPIKPCPAGQERSEETGHCRSLSIGGGSELKPCRPDQFRNPLTNRCRLKDSDSGLKPCREDQFRNPETNRCKLITTASSTLKPCNADQFRNPTTNRCKKIDSGNTLKPCKSNQERNPETNRCRKVRGASSADDLPKVKDIEAPIVSGNYSWILAGIAGGGVLAYAGWEWRRELLALLSRLKP
jgi:hypothetical protein